MNTISSLSCTWYSSSPSSSQSVELMRIKIPGRLLRTRLSECVRSQRERKDAHCLALREQLWPPLVGQQVFPQPPDEKPNVGGRAGRWIGRGRWSWRGEDGGVVEARDGDVVGRLVGEEKLHAAATVGGALLSLGSYVGVQGRTQTRR